MKSPITINENVFKFCNFFTDSNCDKDKLLNIQLGNTSTVLFGNNEEIFGLHPSIFDIFENADEVGIDKVLCYNWIYVKPKKGI